jgi:protein-tyrosine phosphatase
MAEGLAAAALPDVRISSAGLGALVGMPADETAVRLMLERGIEIHAHRARQITRAMCIASDLVLVMNLEQRARLLGLYSDLQGKVFRLGDKLKVDIPDPFTKSEAAFRESLSLIEQSVNNWSDRIRRLGRNNA